MAVPPTIPTSFVPHSAAGDSRRSDTDFVGAVAFLGYFIFILSVVAALAMFGYDRLLAAQQRSKDAALAAAEVGIDSGTIAHFVRLRDRLVSSRSLLDSHIVLSNFFTYFAASVPKSMRFTQMQLTAGNSNQFALTATGVAANFNALASASNSIGAEGRIKNAIFSNIAVTQNNTVTFTLTATVDSALVSLPTGGQAVTTTP